jgi:hypothetical protein
MNPPRKPPSRGGAEMTENEITERIIGSAIEVHKTFGPGLIESVYEDALCIGESSP